MGISDDAGEHSSDLLRAVGRSARESEPRRTRLSGIDSRDAAVLDDVAGADHDIVSVELDDDLKELSWFTLLRFDFSNGSGT